MVRLGELMMILELHRQGVSITAIARRTGRDPKTVRKYIERGVEAPTYSPRSVGRPSKLAAYLDFLHERVTAFPDLSAARLTREIRELEYAGAYTAVKRFLAATRPENGPKPYEVRFETPPGVQAQVDFADDPGVSRIVWLFSLGQGGSPPPAGPDATLPATLAGCGTRQNSRCVARKDRHLGQALRAEPNHRYQVARPNHDRRRAHGAERASQHRTDGGRRSHDRGVPPPDAAAARRSARLPARQHPQAHSLEPAPLPRTARHLPSPREPRPGLQAGQVRRRADRLRPHRHQRAAPCRRQAQHVSRHRPRLQVHLCRVPRRRRQDERGGVPTRRHQRLSVCDPYRADRQRHGLRRSAQEPQRAVQAVSWCSHLRSRVRGERDRAQAHQSPITRGPTARPSG